MRWWHRLLGHEFFERPVSPPLWDVSARGLMVYCSCGKRWAL